MIVFAAIDLKQGEVVQLVGGRTEDTRVRWQDPVGVAEKWVAAGIGALHVVDLDAALGTGSNLPVIQEIVRGAGVPVQVGGGIRDESTLERVLTAGAERAILGTRAVEDARWRNRVAAANPGRIVVAADVRDSHVLTRGWTQETQLVIADLLTQLNDDELAAVLVTDVAREGRMTGIDTSLFHLVCAASQHPVFAAGGIAGNTDVARLDEIGAAGVVLGMALYTGAIDVTTLPGVIV